MLSTLVTTATMVVLYVALVRLIDMNEKEPLWAMLLFFALGGVVAVGFVKLAPPALTLTQWPLALAQELGHLAAMGVGLLVLLWHGKRRGYDEFNGTLDGVVYGATVGLGYATAERLASSATGQAVMPGMAAMTPGMFDGLGTALLEGLKGGVFGAIVGAGLGAAIEVRTAALRAMFPPLALAAAVVANAMHRWIGEGAALSEAGLLRSRIALALPAVAIAAVAAYALRREGKIIRGQLAKEVQTGAVTQDELALLGSALRREVVYLSHTLSLRWGALAAMKTLHNRQVQLAFTRDKAEREVDPALRAAVDVEVATLRAAIADARTALTRPGAAPAGGAL